MFATENPADVTIDAIPGKIFKGHVTQVGELAILRSSGQAATTQATANTQEARDFKVVVTIDNPPADLRPGLSASAKIQTEQKKGILTIPIQALAVRTQKELEEAQKAQGGSRDPGGIEAGRYGRCAQKVDVQASLSSAAKRRSSSRCKRESPASRTSKLPAA